jgi:hypothetical protein
MQGIMNHASFFCLFALIMGPFSENINILLGKGYYRGGVITISDETHVKHFTKGIW